MKKPEQIDFFEKPEINEEGRKKFEEDFHFDEEGRIVDKEGNIYDEQLNLIKEAPREGLLRAKKMHPDKDDHQLAPLARILQKQIEKERRERNKILDKK